MSNAKLTSLLSTLLIQSSRAYNTFQPECTLPDSGAELVQSPNVRGTFGIIWTCLGVMFACVYTLLHLNIPWTEKQYGRWRKHKRVLSFIAPVGWSIATILVPEWVYGCYLMDFYFVRAELRLLHKNMKTTKPGLSTFKSWLPRWALTDEDMRKLEHKWTWTHMWYAQMGGFVVQGYDVDETTFSAYAKQHVDDIRNGSATGVAATNPRTTISNSGMITHGGSSSDQAVSTLSRRSTLPQSTTKLSPHGDLELNYLDVMPTALSNTAAVANTNGAANGAAATTDQQPHALPDEPPLLDLHISPQVLRQAITKGYLNDKAVPEEDIMALAKTDSFAKLIVALQLLYFTITVLTRLIDRLPISPLEVGTTSFALCSGIVECFVLNKPKNASRTMRLKTTQEQFLGIRRLLLHENDWKLEYRKSDLSDYSQTGITTSTSTTSQQSDVLTYIGRPKRMGWIEPTSASRGFIHVFMIIYIGTLFGSIHIAGWNIMFSDETSMWLWRSAALATTLLPLSIGILIASWMLAFPNDGTSKDDDTSTSHAVFVFLAALIVFAFTVILTPFIVLTLPLSFIAFAAFDHVGFFEVLEIEPAKNNQQKQPRKNSRAVWSASMMKQVVSGGAGMAVLYIIGRFILIVEMFRQLASLPPDAYKVAAWSADIPHFG